MWLVAESMTYVYGEDGEDGDEDADEVTITTSLPFYSLVFRPDSCGPVEKKRTPQLRPTHSRITEVWLIAETASSSRRCR